LHGGWGVLSFCLPGGRGVRLFFVSGWWGQGGGLWEKNPESGCHMYMRLPHDDVIITLPCDKNPGAHVGRPGQGGVGVPFKKKEPGGNFFAGGVGPMGGWRDCERGTPIYVRGGGVASAIIERGGSGRINC